MDLDGVNNEEEDCGRSNEPLTAGTADPSTPPRSPLHMAFKSPVEKLQINRTTPPQTPNTMRNVGRWRKGKLIGRGASGQVYVAHLYVSACISLRIAWDRGSGGGAILRCLLRLLR